jgi:hypothetical protein
MNDILQLVSKPFVSLAATQAVGLLILFGGLDTDKDIVERSGTYCGHNIPMMWHLAKNNYDQKIGLFTAILPTLLQASPDTPFWTSYACLLVGLFLRFSFVRSWSVGWRIKRIAALEEEMRKSRS